MAKCRCKKISILGKLLPVVFWALLMATSLFSCGNKNLETGDDKVGGTGEDKDGMVNDDFQKGPSHPLTSCKTWGTANLCLSVEGIGRGRTITPTLTFKGLDKINGKVRLFSDSVCSNFIGTSVDVTTAAVEITALAQNTFTVAYYAQYTHTDNTQSPCLGPVVWRVEENPIITISSSIYSRLTFTVSELILMGGRISLYSDSVCTISASGQVSVNAPSHQITANPLSHYGIFNFYARHSDSANENGGCIGPVSYNFSSGLLNNNPNFSLHPSNEARDDDSTPTFTLTNLDFESGTIQLFSNGDCSTTASTVINYSYLYSGAVISANPLSTLGKYNYWAKVTENIENQSRCVGPVAYEYISLVESETLALTLSSSNNYLDSDPTPTLDVTGLLAHNGTVQLFGDSTCTTVASNTVAVSSGSASITANALTPGRHQFYVQHTDSGGNKGNCFGSETYSMEMLSLTLSSSNTPLDSDTTPTLEIMGLVVHNGTVRLFSDSTCTSIASAAVAVTSGTASLMSNALMPGSYQFYVQHTDSSSNKGNCFGTVVYSVETLTLALSSPSMSPAFDSTPTLEVTGLVVHNGTVQLFSDSTCTSTASGTVAVGTGTASITANALTVGSHQFYVQHTDSSGNKGNCTGAISYQYSAGTLVLTLSSPSLGWGSDDTPTFSVGGITILNGTVQLFSDSSCTTTASGAVAVTSGTVSITSQALAVGNHQFYVQHTDSGGNKGSCNGPVSYSLETLSLALTSPSLEWGSDDTPTFSVGGLVVHNGTVQLFSDSACSTAVSGTVTVTSGTESITTNALTVGNHQFYVQHTDSGGNPGDCVGSADYSLETLALALASPTTSPALDSTPTLSVTGLVIHNGTVQLFSDSTCTTAVSATAPVTGGTASLTTNTLTTGSHQFYVQHTDSRSNAGDCVGPVAYSLELMSLVLSSPSAAWGSDDTPTLGVTGLLVHNGTVQLFSDASCSSAASGTVAVTSGTASITANALTTGNHQFYVQHTDSSANQGGCVGPVAYRYSIGALTLVLSSPSIAWGSDDTPTFTVGGIAPTNGTVQLFSDSTCTSTASGTVAVTSGTASITANALASGNHQFYVQHADSGGNKGSCAGPLAYSVENLTLTLSSPSVAWGSDDTPTFSVGGITLLEGTVRLFSDSVCTTAASATVAASSGTVSITANALAAGDHQFYIQHTDASSNDGDCVGAIAYSVETLALTLSSPRAGWGSDDTPTFSVRGLVVHDGTVQLFSDSACTSAASGTVAVTSGTASITTNALPSGNHQFYVRHTDSGGNQGSCVGPAAYSLETLSLALTSPATSPALDSTPTLSVTGLLVHNGTVQLFSDSACTSAASGTVAVASGTVSITANALAAGDHEFYIQHTDSSSNDGDCFGPVAYSIETLSLALSSPSASPALDSTPTLSVTGLLVHNGTVQLFSDSACTSAASGTVAVTSGTVSITANALAAGDHEFYIQHTDSGGNQGNCFGPVAYSIETLTLTLSSPSVGWGSDGTPTFSVGGITLLEGTVRLFSDSVCTVAASATAAATSGTVSITANTLTPGNHQFYIQHTDSSGNTGDCIGPVAYLMETLSLALSSSNVPFDSDPTPTFEVVGLVLQEGTVQLFGDLTCTTAVSTTVAVTSGTASLSANTLTTGLYEIYVQHTDSGGNDGDCVGPVAYRYSTEALTLALSSPSIGWGSNSTPTFSVTGLLVHNGTVQLFSDSTCSTAVSSTVVVSSSTASIITNALNPGNHEFYVQHTDSSNNKGHCVGSATYLRETLTLTLSSSNVPFDSDSTPMFDITGLVLYEGTVQLFSEPTCTTSASGTVAVTAATASLTANVITTGLHQFYVQHTDSSSNKGDCVGLVAYRYSTESLVLALSSPSVGRGTDDTPTFSVTGIEVLDGTIQLFSEPTCTTSASGMAAVTAATASLTAHSLTIGEHDFYVQHIDVSNNKGRCVGPVTYEYRENFYPISAGGYSTCFILDDASLECWGKNDNGQLGDGSVTDRSTPVVVNLGTGKTAKAISVGNQHTCAILDDNSLKCWGSNNNGRLGDGTLTESHTPVAVNLAAGSTAKAIASGHAHTCAILNDDSLKCWGFNGSGRLGDGTDDQRTDPTNVNLGTGKTAKAVSLGNTHTCAILNDDSLKCWGSNGSGRLGDGTATTSYTPVSVNLGADRTAKAIALGASHACAILDDDSLKCWGSNTNGRLGDGTSTARNTPTAVNLGPGRTAKAIDLGGSHTCAILDNDSVKCWGNNSFGQLGDGNSPTLSNTPVEVNLGASRTAIAIDTGFGHSCALLDDDSVKCWGANGSGQLGDGSNTNTDVPTAVVFN